MAARLVTPLDLLKLLTRDFMPMNLMCEQPEVSELGIFDRTTAACDYFGLSFDAEPSPLSASHEFPWQLGAMTMSLRQRQEIQEVLWQRLTGSPR